MEKSQKERRTYIVYRFTPQRMITSVTKKPIAEKVEHREHANDVGPSQRWTWLWPNPTRPTLSGPKPTWPKARQVSLSRTLQAFDAQIRSVIVLVCAAHDCISHMLQLDPTRRVHVWSKPEWLLSKNESWKDSTSCRPPCFHNRSTDQTVSWCSAEDWGFQSLSTLCTWLVRICRLLPWWSAASSSHLHFVFSQRIHPTPSRSSCCSRSYNSCFRLFCIEHRIRLTSFNQSRVNYWHEKIILHWIHRFWG